MISVQRLVMASISLLFVAAHSWATPQTAPPVEFSAESVTESGGTTVKETVFYAPGKVRRELDVGRGKQIEITRLDKKVAWLLMTEEKLYLERSLTLADEQSPSTMNFEKVAVGEEIVNDTMTTKYRTVTKQADGATLSGFVWSTKEGITVKMDLASDGTAGPRLKMELKNLKIGKHAPGLFEIPANYRKFSLGGFDPGGGMGSARGTGEPGTSPSEPGSPAGESGGR
jgi:hypothetical protein